MTTTLDLLEDASSRPSDVFFVPAEAEPTSFEALWRRSERAAAFWSQWPRGTAVGGLLGSSADLVAAFVGAWRAGLRFVSLPLPARTQTPEAYRAQIDGIIRVAELQAIVVEDKYLEMLPDVGVPLVAGSRCHSYGAARLDEIGDFVQFSSGTTGSPKGVCLSLESIGAAALAQIDALGIGPGDVSCFWVPLSHDFGLIGGLLSSWAASTPRLLGKSRGRFVCLDPAHFIVHPWSWMETCAEHAATITGGPAFAYGIAARHLGRRDIPGGLKSLRACIIGAEPIVPATIRAFTRGGAPHGLDESAICPAYGLAEASLAVTMKRRGERWTALDVAAYDTWGALEPAGGSEIVCSGSPVQGVEVRIEGTGQVGEIRVRTSAAMSGYLNRDGGLEDGWIQTGDYGFLREEGLYVVGRADAMIVIGGQNASAEELERRAEGHPQVRPGNCAVCADGAGRYRVALEHRAGESSEALEGVPLAIRDTLTRFLGVAPSGVILVPPGTLPKTPSGKLQRNAVRKSWETLSALAVSRL